MPKKTRDEFKQAFKAIKKPSRPKNVSGKIKNELEEAVVDGDIQDFEGAIDQVLKLDRGYLIDLVAYKLGKHFEADNGKMPFWHKRVPQDVLKAAMTKIIPGDFTDPATERLMDTSMLKDDVSRVGLLVDRDPAGAQTYLDTAFTPKLKTLIDKAATQGVSSTMIATAQQLYKRDPNGTIQFLLDSRDEATRLKADAMRRRDKAKLDGDEDEEEKQDKLWREHTRREGEFAGAVPAMIGPDYAKVMAKYLLQANTGESLDQLRRALASTSPADVREIAADFPGRFIQEVLGKADSVTRLKLLNDPQLRQQLEQADKTEWDKFAADVPMLRLYDAATLKRANVPDSGNKVTEQSRNADAIFEAIMDGTDVKVAYVGTRTTNPSEIMASMTPVDPVNPPRTDCHSIRMLLMSTIGAYPGMDGADQRMRKGECTNMLMTKKLTEIGQKTRGMIDKNFTGNVFDDSSTPTGQILFTGEDGVNSHSWLELDGKAYDPVLGISGTIDDVKTGSTFCEFDSKIGTLVGTGADGWYFIKDDPSIIKPEKPRLTVAANAMSFNTAYYLTKDPSLHLTPEALKQVMG